MPVVDPNNWVPQYDAREDQETITPITQPDGSVRYFQGNYDEVGEIDRVIIEEPGKYAAGVTPRVRLVDENGDEIAANGAAFRLMMSARGEILRLKQVVVVLKVETSPTIWISSLLWRMLPTAWFLAKPAL